MISVADLFRRTGTALEIDELREPRQHREIDPDRMSSDNRWRIQASSVVRRSML
jgi:hypothetical protein